MENENNVNEEFVRRKQEEEEDLVRDLERQSVYSTHKQLSWQLQLQDEIEKEREQVRREQEQEDQERDLERQEEIDQEYGDGYKCMNFCGDHEDQVLER